MPAVVEVGGPQHRPWAGARQWSADHRVVVDAILPALLDVWVLTALVHRGSTAWWEVLLSQVLVLPLVIRRRAPWLVFGLLAGAAAVQWLAEVRFLADAALLIALYTVAAYQPRRRALIAAGVLELGVLLASIRFAPTGDGIIASLVFLSGLVAAALFGGITVQTRRDYLASLVGRAAQLERERDQQVLLATTAERARIAREMHDVIAHSLSVIITLADGAALANQSQPAEATEAMLQVAATGRMSMTEMRRLLGVLRDSDSDSDSDSGSGSDGAGPGLDFAPQPGLERLDALIAEVRSAGLPVQLSTSGVPRPLPPTTASAAYRIVQEGLTNALKHAREATRVHVTIQWEPDRVRIIIVDDGAVHAPDVCPEAGSPGHGLIGMRERAALFGGTITAGPAVGHGGWQVRATLPLDPP